MKRESMINSSSHTLTLLVNHELMDPRNRISYISDIILSLLSTSASCEEQKWTKSGTCPPLGLTKYLKLHRGLAH
jgi:hypothetical protein